MAQRYLHIDIETCQASKYPQGPCGDVIVQYRTELATDIILCDGIGSGMRAYIAATMHATRLQTLLQSGFSLRRAFSGLVATLDNWRDPEKPYAAVSVARILNDGEATVLTYDAPRLPAHLAGFCTRSRRQGESVCPAKSLSARNRGSRDRADL